MQWAKRRGSRPSPGPESSDSPVQPGDAAGKASCGTHPRGCTGSGLEGHQQPFMGAVGWGAQQGGLNSQPERSHGCGMRSCLAASPWLSAPGRGGQPTPGPCFLSVCACSSHPPFSSSSSQTLSLPSSVGTEMVGGLLPCHGGRNAWMFALGSRMQRGEMLCARMCCADWPAWASPASPAGLREMLERSEVLHTLTPPLPHMLS